MLSAEEPACLLMSWLKRIQFKTVQPTMAQ